ncbi:MAG TPA: hypothetical protein VKH44_01330 [Pirellulaceae bacterium]|nr:hypothetical protein [Pirellulaceae bacterium]
MRLPNGKDSRRHYGQVLQIYQLARLSDTPLSVLNMQGTIVLAQRDWDEKEVERVNGEVLDLLIKNGWQNRY